MEGLQTLRKSNRGEEVETKAWERGSGLRRVMTLGLLNRGICELT